MVFPKRDSTAHTKTYIHIGTPGRNRTSDLSSKNRVLCLAELQAPKGEGLPTGSNIVPVDTKSPCGEFHYLASLPSTDVGTEILIVGETWPSTPLTSESTGHWKRRTFVSTDDRSILTHNSTFTVKSHNAMYQSVAHSRAQTMVCPLSRSSTVPYATELGEGRPRYLPWAPIAVDGSM